MNINNIKIPQKIKEKLKKLKVGVVYLFGSQTTGATHPMSDFDVGVVFADSKILDSAKQPKLHCKLYDIFSDILPLTLKNDVDIVYLQKGSPMIQMDAIKHGIVIYEDDAIFRVNYEEKVVNKYLDYKPYFNEFYDATLKIAEGVR